MSPLISIIIATYNAEETLHDALESVLNQSFQDWECLVVDGASKDNTVKIIEEFCKHDKRFRFISEPDKGIYDAFNKGWRMAKGEWIYYLGADDLLLKDALEDFEKNVDDSDVIYGNTIFDTGLRMKKSVSISPEHLKGRMVSHQCILMKKSCIEQSGGFDTRYKISADFALIQKALKNGFKFKHIDCYIAVFKCGGVSSERYANIFEVYRIKKEQNLSTKIGNIAYIAKRLSEKFVKKQGKIIISIFIHK